MKIQHFKQIAIDKIKKQQQSKVTHNTNRTSKLNTKSPAKPKTPAAAYNKPAKNITHSHKVVYIRPAEARQAPEFIKKIAEAIKKNIKHKKPIKPKIKPWISNH